ncbi:CDP-glycerol glycerophosphotransferase family protein [Mammaliicoccus sciuri]|uniref:CDP-glycerol glycerophosphotransferase family protein n=1 Tax=Mammaliicoccus sciuri TaxID=1296 RepID=UPI0015E5F6E3|nr:CDP-glycerol glycerophosphotransferase family protein [Mammaliicoccus sciuri]MBA1395813.1 glycosyltransferase [Mammaliicoccus sciuri]MCJ0955825.1 CDP-glycerol glycerophosphotransferase family protein [Mammaliicoccus sciuri]
MFSIKKQNKKVFRSKKYKKLKPIISVVVPVYNAEEYLLQNVESYQNQTFKNWELILVNDGSTDNTLLIMKDLAKKHSNITIVDQNNGGVSDARNSGVKVTRSEFIFFIDPDDFMENKTLEVLYESIISSDSDVALTGYNLVYGEKFKKPGIWIQNLFKNSLTNITVAEHPEILQASTPWGKLIRTKFYKKNNLHFIKGIHYEDQIFTSELYIKAKSIDIVSGYNIHWVQRENSITHQKNQIHDLKSRFFAAEKSLAILSKNHKLKQERLVQYLNHDFRFSLLKIRVISDEFDTILLEKLPHFYNQLDDKSQVASIMDTAYRLILNKKYNELYEFINETNLNYHKAKVIENNYGEAVVDYSTLEFINLLNESSLNEIQTEELIPEAKLFEMNFDEKTSEFVLTIQAYLKKLSRLEFNYKVTADIIELDEKTSEDINIIQHLELEMINSKSQYTRDLKEWWFNAADTFYKLSIPVNDLKYNTSFRIRLNIQAGNYIKELNLESVRSHTNVQYNYVNINNVEQIRRKSQKNMPLYFKKVPIASITDISEYSGELTLSILSGSPIVSAALYAKENEKLFRIANLYENENKYIITVPIKDIIEITKLASSNIINTGQPKYRFLGFKLYNINNNLILPVLSQQNVVQLNNVLVRNNNKANLDIILGRTVNILDAQISEGNLKLKVNISNSVFEVNDVIVKLTSKAKTVEYRYEMNNNSKEILTIPLTYYFYGEERSLPLSRYKISVWVDSGQDSFTSQTETFSVSESYIRSLPFDYYNKDDFHHYKLEYQTSNNRLYITSFNNISDNHKGGYGWGNLLTQYKLSNNQIDSSKILMISYMGDVVDNSLSEMNKFILNNEHYGKTIYWAIKDRSFKAPKGAIPVIIGSDHWFRILATAKYIYFNVHQNIYVEKKPGQIFVQFFHGYPFKGMGSIYYNEMEYTNKQKYDFSRRENEWDYVVSPSPYATPLYKKYFNLSNNVKMIEVGYPRNDELVNNRQNKNELKLQNIKERLNIPPKKKIILYAPTFREYVLNPEEILNVKGKEVQVLDLAKLSQDLGEEFIILARGHYSYTRGNRNSQDYNRVIDVTTYPDVNELITISDLAILDYSSLRFDYAQTFKPVIFYTPDYKKYFNKRSGLIPYEETIYGPKAMNYKELLEAIFTIDQWIFTYKEKYNEFIHTYTPLEDGNAAKRITDIILNNNKELVYRPKSLTSNNIIWTHIGARSDIDKFYTYIPPIGKIRLLKKQNLYSNVNFHDKYKTEEILHKNIIIDVKKIEWTKGGTPRFVLNNGLYLSTNKENVTDKIRSDINSFITNIVTNKVKVLADIFLYNSIDFTSKTRTSQSFKAGSIIDVHGIEWTKGGTPRLRVKNGLITANIKFVKEIK